MPELPEVQTVVDDLNHAVVGYSIRGVWFDWPRMIKAPTRIKFLLHDLKNRKILKVERRAKYIKIYLSDGWLLVFHLKMTGRFRFVKQKLITLQWRRDNYAHFILFLNKGMALVFSDVRKFGTVRFAKSADIENLSEFETLGPEPLIKSFNVEKFGDILKSTSRKIKQVLMDPKMIAGIGNIYSDEALWLAKINPVRRANNLNIVEIKSLLIAIKKILNKSLLLRGTSSRDYRDLSGKQGNYYDQRLVYYRENERCRRCGTKIKRLRIGGRSVHFCPKCQS
ncbi:MAG: DNA-formamidopyrimidine glycosylase [bacterium]|nr:DNA-formamidopyrimidine glycosylase [bacterium]